MSCRLNKRGGILGRLEEVELGGKARKDTGKQLGRRYSSVSHVILREE